MARDARPGDPIVSQGLPSLATIVGGNGEITRRPGPAVLPGKLLPLFIAMPSTTRPVANVLPYTECVTEAMLPSLSTATRWSVSVEWPSCVAKDCDSSGPLAATAAVRGAFGRLAAACAKIMRA